MTPVQVKEAAAWLDLLNRIERALGQIKQPDYTFQPTEVGADPIRIPDVDGHIECALCLHWLRCAGKFREVAGDPVKPPSRVSEALARHGLEVAR